MSSRALMDANHQQRSIRFDDCAAPEFLQSLERRSFLRFFLPLVPSKVEQFHHVPQWCPKALLHEQRVLVGKPDCEMRRILPTRSHKVRFANHARLRVRLWQSRICVNLYNFQRVSRAARAVRDPDRSAREIRGVCEARSRRSRASCPTASGCGRCGHCPRCFGRAPPAAW